MQWEKTKMARCSKYVSQTQTTIHGNVLHLQKSGLMSSFFSVCFTPGNPGGTASLAFLNLSQKELLVKKSINIWQNFSCGCSRTSLTTLRHSKLIMKNWPFFVHSALLATMK